MSLRSGPLRRRRPLAPGGLLKRSGPLARRTPLKARSARRQAEVDAGARQAVRAAVEARDGASCALAGRSRCWHPYDEPLDLHEVARRGTNPGSHLDPACCILLCRRHHDWDLFLDYAETVGIRVRSTAYARHGQAALDEAARLREQARLGNPPSAPFWRRDERNPNP